MPKITRVYIKTAVGYLLASLVLWVLSSIGQREAVPMAVVALQPVYYHFFMLGWATQMIFGVAWWMFPRSSRQSLRGKEWIAWLVFWLLNIGLIMRAVAEPLETLQVGLFSRPFLIVSSLCQMVAVWIYALALWPRIQPPKLRNQAGAQD